MIVNLIVSCIVATKKNTPVYQIWFSAFKSDHQMKTGRAARQPYKHDHWETTNFDLDVTSTKK